MMTGAAVSSVCATYFIPAKNQLSQRKQLACINSHRESFQPARHCRISLEAVVLKRPAIKMSGR